MANNQCNTVGAVAWTELSIKNKCSSSLFKLNFDGNFMSEDAVVALKEAYGGILMDMKENDPDEEDGEY